MKGNLVIIVGPTAVGKTDLCVKFAQLYGAEILSCDSRQIYREMHIGTAKPSVDEMQGVVHHFIDSSSINTLYSAGDYERDVDNLLKTYFLENNLAIMTGGTGLFVKAVLHGLDDMPAAPEEIRRGLMEQLNSGDLEGLQQMLKEKDPETYVTIDISNSQRVVRALEVCISTGIPFSSFKKKSSKTNNFNVIKIGLERPREELYDRINQRVDLMLESGLVKEVENLMPYAHTNALQTVGYKEVISYLRQEISYPEMGELIKRNTRRYAKRQMTWFKNQDSFEWFHPDDYEEIKGFINNKKI